MQPLSTPPRTAPAFRIREFQLRTGDPARFLSLFEGRERGFWGRGSRWAAWGGAAARIEVPHADSAEGSGPARFDLVRREAARLLGGALLGTSPPASDIAEPPLRPRLFGGFSFLAGPGGDPVWEGFPVATFVLPRVVLEGDGDRRRLLLCEPAGRNGAGPDDIALEAGRIRDELELRGPPPSGTAPSPDAPAAPHPGDRIVPGAVRPPSARDRAAWDRAVESVLAAVRSGAARKAVLARTLDLRIPGGVDVLAALDALRSENPRAHVFFFESRPGRVFLGAAPEILAELRSGRFQATAVAGSIPRGRDEGDDRRLALDLLKSGKDLREHELTAEEMSEVLAPRLGGMEIEEQPRVLTLARIQHLETVIRGQAGEGEDVLSLVEALHPTPAVCGRPRDLALQLIRDAEPFDRGWYAGPVGWFDAAGDGDFVPALRAAVGGGTNWRLFAGAGIVEGSLPDAEWDETALKFEPALRALGAGARSP